MTVIVILALVALFIGLRLYSVLGERTGHEQSPSRNQPTRSRRLQVTTRRHTADPDYSGDMAFVRPPDWRPCDPAADRIPDVARFLDGAKSAYRMILAYLKAISLRLRTMSTVMSMTLCRRG